MALIFVDAAGENAIAVAPGANMALTADDVGSQEALLAAADVVRRAVRGAGRGDAGCLPAGT